MTDPSHRIRVALVFGGRSTEHAISCVSAGSVLAAVDRERYDVVAIGITPEGRWVLASDDPSRLAIRDRELPHVDPAGATLVLPGDPTAKGIVVLEPGEVPAELGSVDVVFPLLHGAYGEDGTIQGLLELAGVPYVGSGVLSSAVAMDKEFMKLVLITRGLPVTPYSVIHAPDWERDRAAARQAAAALDLPVFVKPARGGSSIGITKVKDWSDFDAAVHEALRHDPKVLVEANVDGREIECGVLDADNGSPEASLPAEVKVTGGQDFYDFDAKYLDDATSFDVPAELPAEVTERVRRTAVAAYRALACEGLARVDFFLRADGSLVVNEVNTMPGFTPASMFPRMWAAAGVDYPTLIDRLLRGALRRGTGLR